MSHDDLDNIKVVPGYGIPYHQNYRTNVQCNYMEFKNFETMTFKYDPESSENRKKMLRDFMKGKQAIIVVKNMGETGGLTDGVQQIMSSKDAEMYSKLPCCIQTSYGTLVPQIVIPTKNVIDNGMEYPEGVNVQITQSRVGKGYTWTPDLLDKTQYNGDQTLIEECIASQLTYGERLPLFNCVTNENSAKIVDKSIYTTRTYRCETDAGAAGTGSCAICYNFIKSKNIGDGDTQEEKDLAPQMVVQLAGRMDNEATAQQVNTIGATISESGQIIGVCGENVAQGSMSEPSNDIMPPQCRKQGGEFSLLPLYMYPLYGGFVMTNSALGNLKDGSSTLFIKYDEVTQNPIYTAKVNNVHKSHEMKDMDEVDNTSELMKWFPTLYQECADKDSIKIYVPRSEKIDFADEITLKWMKSLGRFAYCPIYFHRIVKFTLYFKGEYKSPRDDSGMDKNYGFYRFYPLVCANIGKETSSTWNEIDKDGANCVWNVRLVTNDDDLQESIYAVDFEFTASRFQRYPIEIFGAVAVYERPDFQFKVENSNGRFTYSEDVFDAFTGFAEEQDSFGVGNGLFGLISNVSISASLDGVSGSMTLDGFPLKQGLKVFRQKQSIGEIDLAVVQNGVTHQLFSGYGMELGTNDSENSYNVSVNLVGINRKLEDMKLICAPFWDGDRLEMIMAYFEEYSRIQVKMVDHTVTSYNNAKWVSNNPHRNGDEAGMWESDSNTIVNSTSIDHPAFRVPRSCDWRSPAVNFNTGTAVMEALKQLGQLTGCVCVPQLDGSVTYYELNNLGFPFYVDNQTYIVEFDATDIVSISMQPQLQNKYNSIATFGFLQRKNPEGKILAEENVEHGAFYSKTNGGNMPEVGVQFPWSRQSVGVESAMYTKMELAEVHANRVKMFTADQYLGNMTVRGNTKVNHIYQKIRVCGQEYFVVSIEHSLDLGTKIWTTSYQLQCINRTGNPNDN